MTRFSHPNNTVMAVVVCSVYITMASTVNEHGCVVVMKGFTVFSSLSLSFSQFFFISFGSDNIMKNAKSDFLFSIQCSAVYPNFSFKLASFAWEREKKKA
jgi:hypothetical protein